MSKWIYMPDEPTENGPHLCMRTSQSGDPMPELDHYFLDVKKWAFKHPGTEYIGVIPINFDEIEWIEGDVPSEYGLYFVLFAGNQAPWISYYGDILLENRIGWQQNLMKTVKYAKIHQVNTFLKEF